MTFKGSIKPSGLFKNNKKKKKSRTIRLISLLPFDVVDNFTMPSADDIGCSPRDEDEDYAEEHFEPSLFDERLPGRAAADDDDDVRAAFLAANLLLLYLNLARLSSMPINDPPPPPVTVVDGRDDRNDDCDNE